MRFHFGLHLCQMLMDFAQIWLILKPTGPRGSRFRFLGYPTGQFCHGAPQIYWNRISPKQGACIQVNKFGFLKTHKCGSTTIQNMLLRYVVKHDLNVVVPVESEKFLRSSLP